MSPATVGYFHYLEDDLNNAGYNSAGNQGMAVNNILRKLSSLCASEVSTAHVPHELWKVPDTISSGADDLTLVRLVCGLPKLTTQMNVGDEKVDFDHTSI